MKKLLAFVLIMMFVFLCVMPATAAQKDTFVAAGEGDYSVVSAVVNKTYDFKDDFHDSYPYDEDFYTEGIFELDDYKGDVTITLKKNSTGEEFVYEEQPGAEWTVKTAIDYLLYDDTTELDAVVHIYDLGGDYGIADEDVPVKITVNSSLYEADFHKYPSYDYSYTSMVEGEHFTIDYDPSSTDGKATINILMIPNTFELCLYNVETKEREYFDQETNTYEFPTQVEITDFDPSKGSFWFHLFDSKLIMDDGYVFEFTLSVDAKRKNATEDEPVKPTENNIETTSPTENADDGATKDSTPASPDSSATKDSVNKAVKTGEPYAVFYAAGVLIALGVALIVISKKRGRVQR